MPFRKFMNIAPSAKSNNYKVPYVIRLYQFDFYYPRVGKCYLNSSIIIDLQFARGFTRPSSFPL